MNKLVSVELDSYRLAQYAVQVPCYICGQGNTFDAELCRLCFAPMALAHQSQSQKLNPKIVAAIGPSGAGKTVYLGMLLDMLSRQPERMQALVRGAFSVTLQQVTTAAMARCEFPSKTPNEPDRWNWVHCQVTGVHQRRAMELIMPDLAGEALFEEVDHPNSCRVIRSLLEKCSGVLVLIDALKLQSGSREQDYFTMKLLSYLSELGDGTRGVARHRPVALIFSKADQCEQCFEDPMAFAERHSPGLWQHCRQRFRNHQFFASGVAGACVYRPIPGGGQQCVPLRIEPRGVLEPFEWLVEQIKS